MEECGSLDSEMTDLQEFQSELSEAISQDDEDEIEELQNSLREAVQDQSVKPKLQCLMVDPSFSMVTVQSEDSGIVWETASSRCSTPWASETSSISEGYSMEGSGAAGKITIVFDEEKIIRRRTRSGGRSSRLGDRLSRPGSSRSASALGVERLEMSEVSLPNVKQEKPETEPDLEEIKNKDQQLFSLISDGYEILNIRVPSKLPTVDEEESTELQDNLSYLDQTPKIRSRNHHDWKHQQNHALPGEEEILDHQESSEQESSQPSADAELRHTPTPKESTGDIDYFEKFTLVDVVVPEEQAPELQEVEGEQPAATPQAKETATVNPSASEDSFVFVTDVEIAGEHLDEVFYGEGAPADEQQRREDDEGEGGTAMRRRRESQRSTKESGSVLFGSEETILTPIFISPGPPKIIDPILLEEPTAMSFMYSDLYEDAVGERRRSDEEYSEAESVTSEKSYKRRLSDAEEPDGYLEKFTLKDEIPRVEVQPEPAENRKEGRMMWSQKHQMEDQEVKHEVKRDQTESPESSTAEPLPKSQQVDSKVEKTEESEEHQGEVPAETASVTETEKPCQSQHGCSQQVEGRTALEEIVEKAPVSSVVPQVIAKSETPEKGLSEEVDADTGMAATEEKTVTEAIEEVEKTAKVAASTTEDTDEIAHVSSEAPHTATKSEIATETPEKSSSEEVDTDTKMAATDEDVVTEAIEEAPAEVKEPEIEGQEMITSTEIETSTETTLSEKEEVVPEDVAPVEVTTECDAAVHAVVEVTEKAVHEKEIQTQVQIDLQEVTSAERTDVETAAPGGEEMETSLESQVPETKTDQESEAKTEILSEVTKPVMTDEVKTESDIKQHKILGSKQHQQEESVPDDESDKTKLLPEAEDKTSTEDTGD
ncbi:Cardiomyopathy-associated protein 5 [Nibea albiflora]|uniref:Cardiomyopathy-associated protein 5 n=1 Tax=Nibea albiflora TaxID=240163 RepID=A0ACB7FD09_NIBAL|nr:Cardiomyopathy-associated protein 5 [Nibea albiflora]